MTITQADEADLLVRFAHVTEGPVMAVEDPCDGRDYKVAVEKLNRAGCVGTVICRAEHDWEYSRLSWKTAEANADYIAWAITNRLEIISAFTHREASEAPLKERIAERDALLREVKDSLQSIALNCQGASVCHGDEGGGHEHNYYAANEALTKINTLLGDG